MTPSSLRRAVEELRDNWNLLSNQVWGRSAKPRADIPAKVAKMVVERKAEFRKWYEHLSEAFLTEMFGLYNSEFQRYLRRYEETREAANRALQSLPTRETLKAPSMKVFKESPGLNPWLIALAAAGFALYFWQRSRK